MSLRINDIAPDFEANANCKIIGLSAAGGGRATVLPHLRVVAQPE